ADRGIGRLEPDQRAPCRHRRRLAEEAVQLGRRGDHRAIARRQNSADEVQRVADRAGILQWTVERDHHLLLLMLAAVVRHHFLVDIPVINARRIITAQVIEECRQDARWVKRLPGAIAQCKLYLQCLTGSVYTSRSGRRRDCEVDYKTIIPGWIGDLFDRDRVSVVMMGGP